MPDKRPAVVLCKWRAEMVPALLARAAALYLVVDRADVARADFDESLVSECAGVYRIGEFDSIEEITAVAVDLAVRGVDVDRVLSFSEDSQLGANQLRLLLGGDRRDQLVLAGARDKRMMKHLAGRAGVPVTPWASLIPGEPFADVGYPAVVKPAYGFGTMNTVRVHSAQEAERVVADLPDLPRLKSDHLIIERFVEGRELHVDALWHDGEPLFFLVSSYYVPRLAHLERTKTRDGSYVLDRDRHPELYARLLEMHRQVNAALAMTTTVTHLEVFETPSGELLFSETAARLGGAWVPDVLSAYLGCSVYEALASGLLTGTVDEPKPPYRQLGAVHLRPSHGGTITALPSDEQLRGTPGVVSWRFMKRVGDPVAFANTMDWCLLVVLGADSEDEFLGVVEQAENTLVIDVV